MKGLLTSLWDDLGFVALGLVFWLLLLTEGVEEDDEILPPPE